MYKITLTPLGTRRAKPSVHFVHGTLGVSYAHFQTAWAAGKIYKHLGTVEAKPENAESVVFYAVNGDERLRLFRVETEEIDEEAEGAKYA